LGNAIAIRQSDFRTNIYRSGYNETGSQGKIKKGNSDYFSRSLLSLNPRIPIGSHYGTMKVHYLHKMTKKEKPND
jgi:hypothetical protein